jgi:hypothetical protein
MRALLSTYGLRGDFGPVAGLAVRLGAPGAQARVCAPLDADKLPTGVMPTGAWR